VAVFWLLGMLLPGAGQAAPDLVANPDTTIFINEIHYDNTGTDAAEAIEIADSVPDCVGAIAPRRH
jgi:hypothetical protein